MIKTITLDDVGKEFSIKLLPNIHNLKNSIDSFKYSNGREIQISNAMVNGKFTVFRIPRYFFKLYSLIFNGDQTFYISKKTSKYQNQIISEEEYLSQLISEEDMDKFTFPVHSPNSLTYFDKDKNIVINTFSVKFKVNEICIPSSKLISYENISYEMDGNNMFWDGKDESKKGVEDFLKSQPNITDWSKNYDDIIKSQNRENKINSIIN